MDVETIQQHLGDEALHHKWEELLSDWEEGTEEQKNHVLYYVKNLRDQFIGLTETIPDQDELERALGMFFIELKSAWINLNTQIQYQSFLQGEPDSLVTYKASLTSGIIGPVEELLGPERVKQINDFLSSKARELAVSEEAEESEEELGGLQGQLEDLYAEKERIYTELGVADFEELQFVVRSMDEQLQDLYKTFENVTIVEEGSVTVHGPHKILVRRKKNQTAT